MNLTNTTSEDCLFLDVYAPTNTTADSRLPVFVFLQGGGFNSNANPNFNGTGLILASDLNIVIVTFNYRVGPYGFLTSQEVADDGDLNVGLKDQRKVLEWVQQYIYMVSDRQPVSPGAHVPSLVVIQTMSQLVVTLLEELL